MYVFLMRISYAFETAEGVCLCSLEFGFFLSDILALFLCSSQHVQNIQDSLHSLTKNVQVPSTKITFI